MGAFEEKFLIIGSNSFSGAAFVDYVLRDNPRVEVVGTSRSPEKENCFLPYKKIEDVDSRFKFFQFDSNHHLDEIMNVVREFRPDYVVNFAGQGMVGQSWNTPDQYFQTNCMAVMNLGNRLTEEKYLKRFIQISSPEAYGSCCNLKEKNAVFRPSTPFAASKAAGDLSLYPFFLHKGLPLVYTRATNVYGPYQPVYRIIPYTIISLKKNFKVALQGGGKAVKSFIHIRDVCDATLKIARHGRNGEVYHISPDSSGISIYDLVKKIHEKMRHKAEDIGITEERLGQDAVYVIDSSKARKELGWQPKINLDQGLDEVIAWVDEYFNELAKCPMDYIHKP